MALRDRTVAKRGNHQSLFQASQWGLGARDPQRPWQEAAAHQWKAGCGQGTGSRRSRPAGTPPLPSNNFGDPLSETRLP